MSILLKQIFIIVIIPLVLFAQDKTTLNFSPLPIKNTSKNIQDFLPLTSYLENELNLTIKYSQHQNYQDIINDLKAGKIDIAYLGPLPFIALKKEYPQIKLLATINQNNGSTQYRCVLTKFKHDQIDTTIPIKVALTQPLSTCGYYMTQKLLKENLGLELKEQKYDYTMSHSNAILSTLEGNYIVAGAKDSIAEKHKTLGMEIIAKSDPLPGFVLVANLQTISPEQFKSLQNTILNIDKNQYKKWKGLFSKGFSTPKDKEYENFDIDFNDIPLEGNM